MSSLSSTACDDIRSQLKGMVDTKLLYLDATKNIPPEGLKEIEPKLVEQFNKVQLKKILERSKLKSTAELDAELHKVGSSIARRREAFVEQTVAKFWLSQQTFTDEKEQAKYLDSLRRRTVIWSIFDAQTDPQPSKSAPAH